MPYDTQLTDDYMGTIHVGSGVVTGAEIVEGCKSVAVLVQSTANFHYKLVDLSRATEVRISPEEFEEIMEQDRLIAQQRPHDRVAIVVPNDEIRALAESWRKEAEKLGWSIEILPSREQAMAWIEERMASAQV